jgi:HD-GYP domain-containing protein (c-di-GMP phosphodiesterase class II)
MKKHPVFAFEMLSKIEFLKPCLDIPYCHHERWDGTGYPRGLKALQIPQAARLFSVVDVWDALHSNRPYRKEWPVERITEYLSKQAGTQFDPAIVQTFVQMILTETTL